MTKSNGGGFTLIELMITIVILGILAAIAYPSYTNYITVARRSEATINLTQIAAQQEKYFTDCGHYAANIGAVKNCTAPGTLVGSSTTTNGYYAIVVAAGPSGDMVTSYTLTATPAGTQSTRDAGKCSTISIDSTGLKTASGTDATSCWKH
jgi:type IV pilus assembly protein PilE